MLCSMLSWLAVECRLYIVHNMFKLMLPLVLALHLQGARCWSKEEANVTTIYLVSSCHLDVGFADTAQNIVNKYFDEYFPEAIKRANELRALGGEERLVFTTHPYLVYLYTNCTVATKLGLHCPNPAQLQEFSDAVKRGDIVWHAFPFNAQMEFYDSTMADFGFKLTHYLNSAFGQSETKTMSQRDVPGITRSIIPILKRNNVEAITVGVNTASMPPAVPTAFNWKDSASGDSIIAMWHPHGYGGQHGPSLNDMVIVPGLPEALAFAIRGDNSGPPSILEVFRNYAVLKNLFPGAKIIASGYDLFVEKLLTIADKLPTYSQEIGDTWIYGIASDPFKTATTRAAMRHFSKCLAESKCSLENPDIFNFAALLLKNGEHTWGKDVKKYLHDVENWQNAEFHLQLNKSNYQDMVNSWMEQRDWGLYHPLDMLNDNNPLKLDILSEINHMFFSGHIDLSSFKQISVSKQVNCGPVKIGFSSQTGGINYLLYNSKTYATDSNQVAQIIYETYTSNDFETFLDEYVYDFLDPYIYLDLGKLGLNGTEKLNVSPNLESLWFNETDKFCVFLLESTFESKLISDYGAPQKMWTHIEIPKNMDLLELFITVYIVNKTATRIPESLSVYFNPTGVDPNSMKMSKLGENISVLNVVKNGSKHLHACDADGISYSNMKIQSNDTALVCLGYPTPFPVPMELPDITKGFSFNIVNNIWGTNYIMWYPYFQEEVSSKYRFHLTVQ